MAQQIMYPAVANSPATELTAALTDIATTVSVLDASKLPDAPNIATIGVDETAETVLYTGKSGNDLTGVTRGFSGTVAKAWGIGSGVARYFTAYDADALRLNVADVNAKLEDISHQTMASGDGITDDTLALVSDVAVAKALDMPLYIPKRKTVRITSSVDMRGIDIVCDGTILIDASVTGYGIMIGGDSRNTDVRNILINDITGGSYASGIPSVKIVGLKRGQVKLHACQYLQLYANAADLSMSSVAYSDFYLGNVETVHLKGESGVSWINENVFYNGRITRIVVDGIDYSNNKNRFITPRLEGTTILFNNGHHNTIEEARFEGVNTVSFGSTTYSNIITQAWASTSYADITDPDITVTDSGVNNEVIRSIYAYRQIIPLLTINSRLTMVNSSSGIKGMSNVEPGLDKLRILNSFGSVYTTDFIPVDDELGLIFRSDASLFRPFVYVFDANKKPILTDPAAVTGVSTTFNAAGYYTIAVNQAISRFLAVKSSTVKYIKFGISAGSSTAGLWFKYMEMYLLASKNNPLANGYADAVQRPPIVSAAITKGFLSVGEIATKTTGGYYQCTFLLDTTSSASAATSATTITLTSATGVLSGDNIGILLDDATTHWTTVNGAPPGTTVTLTVALPSATTLGNRVVVSRNV